MSVDFKLGGPVLDKRWDASNSFMSNTIDNLRTKVKERFPACNSVISNQDMLNAYSVAYLCENVDDEFIMIIADMLLGAGAIIIEGDNT